MKRIIQTLVLSLVTGLMVLPAAAKKKEKINKLSHKIQMEQLLDSIVPSMNFKIVFPNTQKPETTYGYVPSHGIKPTGIRKSDMKYVVVNPGYLATEQGIFTTDYEVKKCEKVNDKWIVSLDFKKSAHKVETYYTYVISAKTGKTEIWFENERYTKPTRMFKGEYAVTVASDQQ